MLFIVLGSAEFDTFEIDFFLDKKRTHKFNKMENKKCWINKRENNDGKPKNLALSNC